MKWVKGPIIRGKDGQNPIAGRDYRVPKDGRTPIKGVDYFDGAPGKSPVAGIDFIIPPPVPGKAGSPDNGEQIITKINSSAGQIDASRIKNLPTVTRELPAISLFGRRGGGSGVPQMQISVSGVSLGQDIRKINFTGSAVTGTRQADGVITIDISGGGTVTSVSNADGTLTISPTTGAVVASVNTNVVVPYMGATGNVNLGSWSLRAGELLLLENSDVVFNQGGATELAYGQFGANQMFIGNTSFSAVLDISLIATSDKIFTFPNVSGTFALLQTAQTFTANQSFSTGATTDLNIISTAGDDYAIRNASGTFSIRNTTDSRNDISISQAGAITLTGPVGANSTMSISGDTIIQGFLNMTGSDGTAPFVLFSTNTGIGGNAGLLQLWAGGVDVFDAVSTETRLNVQLNAQNKIIINIGNAGTDFTSAGGLTLAGALTTNSTIQANGNVTVGADAAGKIVKFFGPFASGTYFLWSTAGDIDYCVVKGNNTGNYPYNLNIESTTTQSWLGIFESGRGASSTTGSFFGVSGDEFDIYNYQGAALGSGNFPIKFFSGFGSALTLIMDGANNTRLNTGSFFVGDANTSVTPNGWNTTGARQITVKPDSGSTPANKDAAISVLGQNAGTLRGLDIWYDGSATTSFIDNRYDLTGIGLTFRMRTNGTPVSVLAMTDTTLTVGDGINVGIGSTTGTKFGASNSKIGVFGATAVVQSTGWSVTAGYTADKAFDPESTTLTETARVLGTLVDQLKTYGWLAA